MTWVSGNETHLFSGSLASTLPLCTYNASTSLATLEERSGRLERNSLVMQELCNALSTGMTSPSTSLPPCDGSSRYFLVRLRFNKGAKCSSSVSIVKSLICTLPN